MSRTFTRKLCFELILFKSWKLCGKCYWLDVNTDICLLSPSFTCLCLLCIVPCLELWTRLLFLVWRLAQIWPPSLMSALNIKNQSVICSVFFFCKWHSVRKLAGIAACPSCQSTCRMVDTIATITFSPPPHSPPFRFLSRTRRFVQWVCECMLLLLFLYAYNNNSTGFWLSSKMWVYVTISWAVHSAGHLAWQKRSRCDFRGHWM